MDVKIIGMRLVPPSTNEAGYTILALFDLHLGPVALFSCGLARSGDGYVNVTWPMRKVRNIKSGVNVRDTATRAEIRRRACLAYEALTGEDAATA